MTKKESHDLRKRVEKFLNNQGTISQGTISELIFDLISHQFELEIQFDELEKTQTNCSQLEVSANKYLMLFEHAPAGYFLINKDGIITEVNGVGCAIFGLKKQAIVNRCFSIYIVPEYRLKFSAFRYYAFKKREPQSIELMLLRSNQISFSATIQCNIIKDITSGQDQIFALITDLSRVQVHEQVMPRHYCKYAISSSWILPP
jgi:two-component system cell cycle sensor histidine kinase/response regulator CckA